MSDRDTRQAELEQLDPLDIKAIATNLGIEKPPKGTWRDTIPWILEREGFGQLPEEAQTLAEAVQEPEFTPPPTPSPMSESQPSSEQPTYPTTFYQQLNLPVCPQCGEKRRTGMGGELLCPSGRSVDQCPVLKAESGKS